MRLMSVTLEGYRRFEAITEIDVAGDVVALVGPNEAGKSTILDAMLALDDDQYLTVRDRSREGSGTASVIVGYVLDDDDRAALADVPGGSEIRWWTLEKQLKDGRAYRYFDIHPAPKRDLKPRHETARRLKHLAESEELTARFGSAANVMVADAYANALAALLSTNPRLNEEQLDEIHLFANTMFKFSGIRTESAPSSDPRVSQELRDLLVELMQYEEDPHPADIAAQILDDRHPSFLMFTPADRELATNYNLNEVAANPPPALANLARLADLNLPRLLETMTNNEPGMRETLLERANGRLRTAFHESWGQEEVAVRLSLSGTVLEILASIPGGGYNRFQERSAGLRSFVALRAFLARHHESERPILLVDEAEQHLHYDAQADLIDVFTEQRLAAKIVYTTHSAGCLPRDLGNGIRVVAPILGKERSTVRKSVWEGRAAGFTPLVFGMGATTFAFLPARNVLLTEGITDAMLFPTLFRESTGRGRLAFQIAPGLSSVGPARMAGLTTEGGSVLFLTDGDDPGRKYRDDLREVGVLPQQVFGLDIEVDEGVLLEDLIDKGLYARAVNEVLRDFQHTEIEYDASEIPDLGRTGALNAWCKSQRLKPPDKIDVAQRLLDYKSACARKGVNLQLLSATRLEAVRDLYEKLVSAFPPSSVSS